MTSMHGMRSDFSPTTIGTGTLITRTTTLILSGRLMMSRRILPDVFSTDTVCSRIHAPNNQQRNRAAYSAPQNCTLALVLLCVVVPIAGCVRIGEDQKSELDSILQIRDTRQRIDEFKKKSYCRQIDLYLYGMKQMPSVSLGMYLAADGDSVVPTLMNRLTTEDDEFNKTYLIGALGEMSIVLPSLRTNLNVVAIVNHEIEAMKDPVNRERAGKSLLRIQGILKE